MSDLCDQCVCFSEGVCVYSILVFVHGRRSSEGNKLGKVFEDSSSKSPLSDVNDDDGDDGDEGDECCVDSGAD